MTSCLADTNFLRDERIDAFLSEARSNTIAISEYTCVECYQGNALYNITRSMRYVCKYPKQVQVLHCAIDLVAEQNTTDVALVRSDLVEPGQTSGFGEFCRRVCAASSGDLDARRQIDDLGHAATERLTEFLESGALVAEGIKALAACTDQDRLKRIRKGEPLTKEDADWFFALVVKMADGFHQDHPRVTRTPDETAFRRSLLFRYALMGCLLMRRWMKDGGIESAPKKRLANDVIDMTIAAYGTYFDAVFSRDEKLLDLHGEGRWILEYICKVPVGV